MNVQSRVAELAAVRRAEQMADAEGALCGPQLLEHSPKQWRRMMRSDPNYRSYGTLKYLLESARERFDAEPTFAYEITSAVIDFVDEVRGPSSIHEIALRGLARKEHANACEIVRDPRTALEVARRAVEIYGEAPTLRFEQARAQLVVSKILRDTGETTQALELARQSAAVFHDHGDLELMNMARMFEAGALFTAKRHGEALAIFMDVMRQAELDGDRLTAARCLMCGAQCARELGDLASANDLYPRALAHFEALNAPGDANTVRWGMAVALAMAGRTRSAISELHKVRNVFLSLGMNCQAASAALEIVRIKFDVGDNVGDLCAGLVPLFAEAGLTQNAIEALAYLREQAKQKRLTSAKIESVRAFFDVLPQRPTLAFARPRSGEDEEEG